MYDLFHASHRVLVQQHSKHIGGRRTENKRVESIKNAAVTSEKHTAVFHTATALNQTAN